MIKNYTQFLLEDNTFKDQLKTFYQDLFITGKVEEEWAQHNWTYAQNMIKLKESDLKRSKEDLINQIQHNQEWWQQKSFPSLINVRNELKDLFIAIYFQTMIFATYFNQDQIRPMKILNHFRFFNHGKAQEFIRNLPAGINALVFQMGKKSGFSTQELEIISQQANPYQDFPKNSSVEDKTKETSENEAVLKLQENLNQLHQDLSLLIQNDILGVIYRKLKELKTT
jgi:hypothetical protein